MATINSYKVVICSKLPDFDFNLIDQVDEDEEVARGKEPTQTKQLVRDSSMKDGQS